MAGGEASSSSAPVATAADAAVTRLVEMGFAADDASAALAAYDGDVEAAAEALADARAGGARGAAAAARRR